MFDSIGGQLVPDVPEIEVAAEGDAERLTGKDSGSSSRGKVINAAPIVDEQEPPTALDRNVVSKGIYIAPIIILFIGIIAYFIVIPRIYGQVVSFIDWLIADPQNIIDTLRDPNAVLRKVHGIIGIRIFWYVWLAAFITSLFFVGRQLQKKPEPNATNALLITIIDVSVHMSKDFVIAGRIPLEQNPLPQAGPDPWSGCCAAANYPHASPSSCDLPL